MQLSEAEQKLLEDLNRELEEFKSRGYLGFFSYPSDPLKSESPIVKLVQTIQETIWGLRSKDPLTGLWIKRVIEEILEQAIAKTQTESNIPVVVAYFDINNTKYINDMLGLTKGDVILQTIAQIIAANLQPFHFASRFGGDEFLAVLNASIEETTALMKKIQTEVTQLVYSAGNTEIRAIIKIVLTQVTREDKFESCLFRLEEKMHQIHHATNLNRNDIWIV
jgi:diguanylate cyclase (GGDEF)-like protein